MKFGNEIRTSIPSDTTKIDGGTFITILIDGGDFLSDPTLTISGGNFNEST
ncbi:hypothetical protein [Alkalihalobacterium alkalinitrilicum]|uniref:hypothetical protein n=1 Tax=Alkalihalobacterium alkalinitrilicum TaxID=427920 RepID=UPI0013038F88|nr:hypothetical protein [Alkalihalobacterium alkalinitrilicum]